MSGRITGGQGYRGDDGSAEPAVQAVLTAFAAGGAGEHDVLTVLAASRLLMPIVAMPAAAGEVPAAGDFEPPGSGRHSKEKSEMAFPTLVGRDGRHAVLAFTCVDSLALWRPDARPVPVPAGQVWQAGVQDASAVVIDVAGPVPVVVDGARLAALAEGRDVPAVHEDPDLLAQARDAVAAEPAVVSVGLLPGTAGGDVLLHLTVAPGVGSGEPEVQAVIERAAEAVMAAAGGRLRRGIEVAVTAESRP